MKRATTILSAGLSTALCLAMLAMAAHTPPAQAQTTQKRVNFSNGNWGTARPAPRRDTRRPASGPVEFFNIFRPLGDGARRRTSGSLFGGSLFGDGRPPLIAPDAPVQEYVEKPKIYVYPQQTLVPLKSARLNGETATPQAAAILRVLRSGAARVGVEAPERRAILAFYKARGFAPLWLNGNDVSSRAQDVLGLLARAGEHGLNEAHYRVPVVWENAGDAAAIAGSPDNLARLDVELTAMALRYARHLSGGVVNPNRLSSYHDLKPPRVAAATALKKLAEAEDVVAWLESLAPRHFAYGLMRQELARLQAGGEEELLPPIPLGRLIRPGMRDERLLLVRRHLRKLGLLPAAGADQVADSVKAEPTAGEGGEAATLQSTALDGESAATAPGAGDATIYDEALVRAIRKFQRMAGLKPDGIIGKVTIGALNRRNSVSQRNSRIAALRLNMERLRWMPRDFGNPHFLVNVPAFEVYLYENGKVRWTSRVITGKPTNQTYFFSDEIEYVEFNPYWGVPQSIIRKEFIPKLMQNPYWLDEEGYEVRDSKGRRISSAAVDWARWRNAKVIPFSIRQLPGDKNALGRLKVMFPNSHAIYMHDTPFKNLFNRSRRAFSHGCVRVHKPRELAELVTGLDPFEIESYLKAGENKQVRVPKKIPVHIAYFTAWPDDAGRMRYYEDVYGRDKLLTTALGKHDAAYTGRAVRQADAR